MWLGDYDPIGSGHPRTVHQAFPNGSLSQGRALLRQVHQLDLTDVSADAEVDVVQPGTTQAEFYRLSMAATARRVVAAGVLTAEEAAKLVKRVDEPDFLGRGFVFIGAWGRRRTGPAS